MVILIMELLTVYYAKLNVVHVLQKQIFAYLVKEIIDFYGLHLIMIACNYYLFNI